MDIHFMIHFLFQEQKIYRSEWRIYGAANRIKWFYPWETITLWSCLNKLRWEQRATKHTIAASFWLEWWLPHLVSHHFTFLVWFCSSENINHQREKLYLKYFPLKQWKMHILPHYMFGQQNKFNNKNSYGMKYGFCFRFNKTYYYIVALLFLIVANRKRINVVT